LDQAHAEEVQQQDHKQSLRGTAQRHQDRGRAKNMWKRTLEKEMEKLKMTWKEMEKEAQECVAQ